MPTWNLSIRPAPETALPAVDVVVEAAPTATVADLAAALGSHLAPDRHGQLVVPVDGSGPWPATRPLAECALRVGDLVDVVTVPQTWRERPAPAGRVRAVVRVVAGPDAGRTIALRGASASIGRAESCTVHLQDPLVSQRHAVVRFDGVPMIADEGSANGTLVGGEPLRRATRIPWGQPITLGATTLVVEPGDEMLRESAGQGSTQASPVYRSPRFGEPLQQGDLEVPQPPQKRRASPLPWAMMLLPMLMGGAMLSTSRNLYTLVFMLAWPLMGFGGWWQQERHTKREFEEDLAEWREDVDAILARLDAAAAEQRAVAEQDHPDVEPLHERTTTHEALWARRVDEPEFLAVRVGRGPVPALLHATLKDGGDRPALRQAQADLAIRATLPDTPVVAPLGALRLIALTGPDDQVDDLLRSIVLRLTLDHSPADLSIVAALGPGRAHHEAWLRWLPHCSRRVGGEAPVAVGPAAGRLLDRLVAEDGGRGHTLVVVDERAGIARRAVEAMAAAAPDRRLHLVWLGTRPDTVPAATDLLLQTREPEPARPRTGLPSSLAPSSLDSSVQPSPRAWALETHAWLLSARDRGGRQALETVDGIPLSQAWRTARMLTSKVDEAAVLPPDTALPTTVRLTDLSPDLAHPDDVDGVLHRWATGTGLRAQIGAGIDGVVTLDLREDGPHGLVAGTTGSGKSELLQSLLCSLAVNNPPSRVTFLLVDYKGGAAFRECADLPHTVGYITDLTPALVHRALASLTAEVAAREELLGHYGVKDLPMLEREHPEAAPPALLICVDEFAALTAEVPDFVDGMVNIAQRGRSLGLHLLLATQRPAGVVTPAIRANTDLRIALRIAGPDDSVDVIDTPDAAYLSRRTPGRAWIKRTGHGTSELVQVAWVGSREVLAESRQVVSVHPFTACQPDAVDPAAPGTPDLRLDPRTDLDRCVRTVTEAFARTGMPRPRRPWLPQLPAELILTTVAWDPDPTRSGPGLPTSLDSSVHPGSRASALELDAPVAPEDRRRSGQVPIGLLDDPKGQRQPELVLDYAQVGHVLVHGTSGSGKTELLRTVAVAASLTDGCLTDESTRIAPYIYGIDFAGGGLKVLADLPTVGGIVAEQQPGRVLRLIRVLKRTVDERSQALAAAGAATLADLAARGHRVPRVHVLVDNLPALVDFLDGGGAVNRLHSDMLTTILQGGRRVGVHLTATAPGRMGVPANLAASFGRRIVLRMTVADDYFMLGVPGGVLDQDSLPGAGLLGNHSVQIATIGGAGTPVQAERLAEVGTRLAPVVAGRPAGEVPPMPGIVPAGAVPAPSAASTQAGSSIESLLTIGVDADAVTVVTADLLSGGPVLVAGRPRSGRSTTLHGLAQLAARATTPPQTVYAAPGAIRTDATTGPLAAYDLVLGTPDALADWLESRCRASESDRDAGAAAPWTLLLVDDAHLWERDAESDPSLQAGLDRVTALVPRLAAHGIALVVACDVDGARTNTFTPGIVQAARNARRGLLLQADGMDGNVLGVTVPMHTVEPLTGPGRGLWCTDGSARVVQAIAGTGPAE
ncbi:MAG TPA: FtsK/SpoIIIE domain-containing protein [Dermatophilaceae bacterium]|nr:FtsK/SpoIIIE domain-containing protein [Dermatophilaceae bacterium]HRW19233.1 FtsK/SpoIIIE domain-containing protein [Dermatophilaceae bacterium]